MQPQTPPPTSPLVLEYFDPSPSRSVKRLRVARIFAGALAGLAFALAGGAVAEGWVDNPVLGAGVWLLVIVGAAMTLRAINRFKNPFRFGWIGAVVVFGLWAAVILSNQTHGKPPPSDRAFIAGFGLSCILAAVGLAVDPRRAGEANDPASPRDIGPTG
jgi:hypothetical protein